MASALQITNLTLKRGTFALGPIDLAVRAGHNLALIGPNGAGKTTLLLAVLGLLRPDGGGVCLLGKSMASAGAALPPGVGVATEAQSHFEHLSVQANLAFHRRLQPSWDDSYARHLTQELALPGSKVVAALSRGERQKLNIITALAHRPRLLLLDEATSGLDPVARASVLAALHGATCDNEMAVVMATHLLGDAAALCDELAFISGGAVALLTDKDELSSRWRRISFTGAAAPSGWSESVTQHADGTRHVITSRDSALTLARLQALGATEVESSRLSLDEITVHVLGGVNV